MPEEALRVVNAPEAGVVPPIGPGAGKDVVDPPRETDVPAIVIAEFAKPAFVSVPVSPSCTFPLLGFVNVSVSPFVAALFSKLIVEVESSGVVFTSNAPLVPLEQVPLNARNPDVQLDHKLTTSENRAGAVTLSAVRLMMPFAPGSASPPPDPLAPSCQPVTVNGAGIPAPEVVMS